MLEHMEMRGHFALLLSDRQGRVVARVQRKNRIVRTGRQLVAQLFGGVTAGTPPSQVTHIGIGTGATPPTDDDTALQAPRDPRNPISEVVYADFDEPVPGGAPGEVVRRTRVSLTAVYDFDQANGPQPLREAGIFTDETGGVMYNRVVFEPVTKTDAFRLTLLWDIVF